MGAIVESPLLVLNSRKYSSKAESPINRSAKVVITRNLTVSRHNCLFIFLFISYFNFFLYVYGKQTLPSYLTSDSSRCYWLAWMNKNICIYNLGDLIKQFLLTLTSIKIYLVCVKKSCLFKLFIFSMIPLPAHTGSKWFDCCGEWFRVVTCSIISQLFSTNGRMNNTRWYITWLVLHSDNGKRK